MSDYAQKRKAKDKAFYIKSAKLARMSAGELGPGMKGFLCTGNQEKDAVREAYNILNEYGDKMYGAEIKEKEDGKNKESEEIEDELEKEIGDLKTKQAKPISERRFQRLQSGVKGCVFIRSTVENPSELVEAVISDIKKSQKQITKFLLRMIPVQKTCKVSVEDILKESEALVDKMEGFKSFSLVVKVRNHSIKRDDIIKDLAEMVKKKFPEIEVNLTNPPISLIVEVVKTTCCLGIVYDYSGCAKYNLVELAQKASKTSN